MNPTLTKRFLRRSLPLGLAVEIALLAASTCVAIKLGMAQYLRRDAPKNLLLCSAMSCAAIAVLAIADVLTNDDRRPQYSLGFTDDQRAFPTV